MDRRRCSFCGYDAANGVLGSDGAVFCTERCRDAADSDREPFDGRLGFKRFVPGVSALDDLLPSGLPANSFVLLAGQGGIRHRGLQTELVWRALERGEPAIVLSFVDPPIAVVEHFLAFDWNVLPHLESGDLQIVDCFTHRLREEHRTTDHQVEWNEYLDGFIEGSVATVRDPTNLRSVESNLHGALEDLDMHGTGLVVIDSLNEVELQGHELEMEQFVKEVRADVCNRKFVPIFASTTSTEDALYAREHSYLFDGIVDMRRSESVVEGVRLKQLSVRKMDGVVYQPHWAAYESAGRGGFRTFDPRTELGDVYRVAPPPSVDRGFESG